MNISHFATQLMMAKTEQQARIALHDYLIYFGFCSYAFTYYAGHIKSGKKLRYHCVSEALRSWHLHYLEQRYGDVDRTLEEAYTTTLPLFWDVHEQLANAKNKREKRIRLESIEFGIDKGLSIPVYGPNQDFAILVLHQRRNETCLSHYKTNQFEWISATQIFYHYIKKILELDKISMKTYKLTRREEQCLALTAKSWRIDKIAKELKISQSTVNFHLQNANKKLGTNNKYETAYKYFNEVMSSYSN